METERSVLRMQPMRKSSYSDGRTFYLSTGVVTEDGAPKADTSLWEAAKILIANGFNLPTQYQLWHFVQEYVPDFKPHVYQLDFEHTRHLILPPNTKSESGDYVLYDADGKPLKSKKRPRLLNPIEINEDNGRKIVKANVHVIPFSLEFGYYNILEDIDPDTGFLKNPPKRGQKINEWDYCVWFGKENKLYAVIFWAGSLNCTYEPSYTRPDLYFRAASEGNLPEEFIETEKDIFQAKLWRLKAEIEKDKKSRKEPVGSPIKLPKR